jgi:hypothetical protein
VEFPCLTPLQYETVRMAPTPNATEPPLVWVIFFSTHLDVLLDVLHVADAQAEIRRSK